MLQLVFVFQRKNECFHWGEVNNEADNSISFANFFLLH